MYVVSEFKVVTELRMSLVFQFTFHSITEYIDNTYFFLWWEKKRIVEVTFTRKRWEKGCWAFSIYFTVNNRISRYLQQFPFPRSLRVDYIPKYYFTLYNFTQCTHGKILTHVKKLTHIKRFYSRKYFTHVKENWFT